DIFAGEVRFISFADLPEHLYGGDDALRVFSRNAQFFICMSADGNIDGVVIFTNHLKRELAVIIADGSVEAYVDAGGENVGHILQEPVLWKPVVWDTVVEHAAKLAALFKDGTLVSHLLEIVGGAQSRRTTANDGDLLAGRFGAGRRRDK